ncbi:TPA: hypothetical protein HA242_06260 [Candidatus Woesearchaeota archaeon]|nr:hypothetical protein [Candidatus Woesearchaeota archaeon]
MKQKLQLPKQGWVDREIKSTEAQLSKAAGYDLFFSKIMFWSALLIIVLANLLISIILVPFLIVLNGSVLYSIVIVLAVTMGFLYNFLLNDIAHLENKHHRRATLIIPLLALGNITVMVIAANRFLAELPVHNQPQNPWMVSIIFAVVFVVPYCVDQLRTWHRHAHRALVR